MGLFKSMKDMKDLTKQGKQLQRQQQQEAGYEPGMKGQFAQMGDMISQANEQLAELTDSSGERAGILANGVSGKGVIIGHSPLEAGAQWQNADIDMEIQIPGRDAYQVNNQFMVPAGATLGAGVELPVKVDSADPGKVAIDWDAAQKAAPRGEVRPAAGGTVTPAAPAATPTSSSGAGAGDSVEALERLAKLRESGALTDAEFEQQKARILGG